MEYLTSHTEPCRRFMSVANCRHYLGSISDYWKLFPRYHRWPILYGFLHMASSLSIYIQMYFEFHKKFRFSRRLVAFSIIGAGVFLSYIIVVTTSIADFSSSRGIAMFIVVIAYPVLDSIRWYRQL